MKISDIIASMETEPPKAVDDSEYRRRAQIRLNQTRELYEINPRDLYLHMFFFGAMLSFAINDRARRPRKGRIIFGPVGCGKTTLVCEALKGLSVGHFTASQIINDYVTYNDAPEYYRRYFSDRDVFIDDLGTEPPKVQKFGVPYSMVDFLTWRYECFKRRGVLTVITTNFQRDEDLTARYGERITSRIAEMCEPLFYNYVDRRTEPYDDFSQYSQTARGNT